MGGFLDEDNKKFEWSLAVLGLVFVLYTGSFGAIRYSVTSEDDCRHHVVDFPDGNIRTVYRPLIDLDKAILGNVTYKGEPDAAGGCVRE